MKENITGFHTDQLYKIGKKDLDKAADVLTDAFAEDPYMHALFGGSPLSDEKARHLHMYSLVCALKYGAAYAPSADMEGVIICYPPDKIYLSDWQYIKTGILALPMATHKNIIKVLSDFGQHSKTLQKKHAPMPHWYLYQIGVGKAHQGKHIASRLLAPFISYCDANRYPFYLETHNESNVALYGHYGFETAEVSNILGTDKPQWCMMRQPKKI